MSGAAAEFVLTREEALTLAVTKLALMQRDLDSDPDLDDRVAKRPVVESYGEALVAAIGREVADVQPAPSINEAIEGIGTSERWVDRLEATIGELSWDQRVALLSSEQLSQGLLAAVSRRDRAIILLIELAAFYPWGTKPGPIRTSRTVRWEASIRREALNGVVDAMEAPVSQEYLWEIDRELTAAVKRLGRKELDWRKVVVVAGGATILGALTGGLAAPLVGSAVGGAMGLSGAAASSAGLALLGGGAVAAGGLGVAGGAMLVAGTAGLGVGGLAGAATWWLDTSPNAVLAEAAKLDVLTRYLVINERSDGQKARLIIQELHDENRSLQAQIGRLEARMDGLKQWAAERRALKDEVEDLRLKNGYLERTVEDLRQALSDATDRGLVHG